MGEAKRRRLLRQTEWVKLFDDGSPFAVAISRPESRPETTRQYGRGVAVDIAKNAAKAPMLCYDHQCKNEIRTMPAVYMFLKQTADDKIPPMAMGACHECAGKSNDEVLAVMRRDFGRYGLGAPTVDDSKHTVFRTETPIAFEITVPNDKIVVAATAAFPHDPLCGVGRFFAGLLQDRKLPHFAMFRQGAHNCHALVNQLYFDFKRLGFEATFSYKRGTSVLIASPIDPEGLHSWIETDGWVIDGAGGAWGNPIMIQQVESFYERLKIKNVRDIDFAVAEGADR